MNKPDWKDAPEWANYLAQDQDGLWYWFEKKPKPSLRSKGGWLIGMDRYRYQLALPFEHIEHWRETLEKRLCQE